MLLSTLPDPPCISVYCKNISGISIGGPAEFNPKFPPPFDKLLSGYIIGGL